MTKLSHLGQAHKILRLVEPEDFLAQPQTKTRDIRNQQKVLVQTMPWANLITMAKRDSKILMNMILLV